MTGFGRSVVGTGVDHENRPATTQPTDVRGRRWPPVWNGQPPEIRPYRIALLLGHAAKIGPRLMPCSTAMQRSVSVPCAMELALEKIPDFPTARFGRGGAMPCLTRSGRGCVPADQKSPHQHRFQGWQLPLIWLTEPCPCDVPPPKKNQAWQQTQTPASGRGAPSQSI